MIGPCSGCRSQVSCQMGEQDSIKGRICWKDNWIPAKKFKRGVAKKKKVINRG